MIKFAYFGMIDYLIGYYYQWPRQVEIIFLMTLADF